MLYNVYTYRELTICCACAETATWLYSVGGARVLANDITSGCARSRGTILVHSTSLTVNYKDEMDRQSKV